MVYVGDIERHYKIYVLAASDDIVRYVGFTSQKLQTRLVKHHYDALNRTKNINKKQWFIDNANNIKIIEIDSNRELNEAYNKERYWIAKYKEDGFELINTTRGGEGCFGYKHTSETIEKISGENNHRYGTKHIEEWKEKMRGKVPHNKGKKTGKPAYNRGKSPSSETLEKLRIASTGRIVSEETKKKMRNSNKSYLKNRKIEAFIDNQWIAFDSITIAANELGLIRCKINMVCLGERKSTGGIFFRYFQNNETPKERDKCGRKGKRIVVELEGIIYEYESIISAANDLSIPRETINRILKGDISIKYSKYKINLV